MITLTTYKWVPDFAQPLMRAFRVRWALEEAGLPYNVRLVTLGPEQRSPEHLARHPFGQAPAVEEDSLTMHESGAIALHIAEKSKALMPKDRIGRERATAWVFSALNSIENGVQELGSIIFFTRTLPGRKNAARRSNNSSACASVNLLTPSATRTIWMAASLKATS